MCIYEELLYFGVEIKGFNKRAGLWNMISMSICVLYIDSITNWEVCLIHVIYSTCKFYNHEFQLYNTINYGLLRHTDSGHALCQLFDLIAIFFLSQHDWEVICTLWHFMFSKPYDPAWIFERSGFDFTQLSIDRILALKKQSLYLHA